MSFTFAKIEGAGNRHSWHIASEADPTVSLCGRRITQAGSKPLYPRDICLQCSDRVPCERQRAWMGFLKAREAARFSRRGMKA